MTVYSSDGRSSWGCARQKHRSRELLCHLLCDARGASAGAVLCGDRGANAGAVLCSFPRHITGIGLKVEQLGLKLAPVWDASPADVA